MNDSEINSRAFRVAELKSECARVTALLGVFGALLALLLVRVAVSLAHGVHGELWPFALLLAAITTYEARRLRFFRRAVLSGGEPPGVNWTGNLFVESLLPTIALMLENHTTIVGPQRTLTSTVGLLYFLFIILSTLHLSARLSRLAGVFSASGYAVAALYTFLAFPEAVGEGRFAYGLAATYVCLLLIAGFTAGAVADQLRNYVMAALREAESRAKIAQLEHDLDIARSIQQGLIPKTPPQVEGFDIAGWNQPADQTGGDYYDWLPFPDGRIAISLADVTGHGIGPALVMSACRAYARGGMAGEPDGGRFVHRMNRLLCDDLPPGKFVTMAAGMLDPASFTMELISAGHGPLLYYSAAEDKFNNYDSHGVPLGLLRGFSYAPPHVLKFAPGDMLILVTDGFWEWPNAQGEDFGVERLQESIRRNRDQPSQEIISRLYSALVEFAGPTPQPDDLTALIVKRQ